MASNGDFNTYCGYSFEEMVDLILKLKEDVLTTEYRLEESQSRVNELLDQVCDLQERISEVLDR